MYRIKFFDVEGNLIATHNICADNWLLCMEVIREYAFRIQNIYPEVFRIEFWNSIPL